LYSCSSSLLLPPLPPLSSARGLRVLMPCGTMWQCCSDPAPSLMPEREQQPVPGGLCVGSPGLQPEPGAVCCVRASCSRHRHLPGRWWTGLLCAACCVVNYRGALLSAACSADSVALVSVASTDRAGGGGRHGTMTFPSPSPCGISLIAAHTGPNCASNDE
jgi:hypothetical protein